MKRTWRSPISSPTCARRRRRRPPSSSFRIAGPEAQRSRAAARRSTGRSTRYLALERSRLARLGAELGDPRFIVVERQQELDELLVRLERRFERDLSSRRSELGALRGRLFAEHPRAVLARARGAARSARRAARRSRDAPPRAHARTTRRRRDATRRPVAARRARSRLRDCDATARAEPCAMPGRSRRATRCRCAFSAAASRRASPAWNPGTESRS